MNRKVLVSLIFVVVILVAGVGAIVINNMINAFHPVNMNISKEERMTVSGNGGNAVIVGNYVYYVGNFVEVGDIKYKQNEYNKVKFGAIYRTLLTNGVPTYSDMERELTDPGYTAHDINDRQLIVPKIAGFENSALYVFDKYLIYTSPNNTKNKYGQLQTDKIDFFRVNLDGSNHRRIYTTSNNYITKDDFTVACYGKNIYLLIKDGEYLRRVSVTGSVGKVDLISKTATSYTLPKISSYAGTGNKSLSASYAGVMEYVYYTEGLSEDDQEIGIKGNVLKQYLISNGESKELYKGNSTEINVLAMGSGKLLYSINENVSGVSGSQPPLYMTKDERDADSLAPFAAATRSSYLILEGSGWDSTETFIMPTEHYTSESDSMFISKATNSLYIYRKVGSMPGVASLINQVHDVDTIIEITSSTIYYKSTSGGGEVMTLDIYKGEAAKGTGWAPTSSARLSYFTQKGTVRIFYTKTFTEIDGEESTNIASMAELGSSGVKEYILGKIADKYLEERFRNDD